MKYLDTNKRGKFLVIYGPNNVGKSTQFSLLAAKLSKSYHEQFLFLKYPVYGLTPTGPQIYSYIKGNKARDNKLSVLELQTLYARNRLDFQSVVESCLKAGIHVIAEDYIGTGLAWGITYGASLKDLLHINNYLLVPDLSILMIGDRFKSSIEKQHIFENAGDVIWNKNKLAFKSLAKKFNWKIIKSDEPIEEVNDNIMKLVVKELKLTTL